MSRLRVTRATALLLAALLLTCLHLSAPEQLTPALAQDAEPAPEDENPDDPPDDVWPGGFEGDPVEPPLPDGVRRPRPQTDAEERRYKQEKTRSDPFLNPPPPGEALAFNPADWVSVELPLDRSVYLIQDKGGKLLGTLSIASDRQTTAAGDYIRVLKVRSEPPERVEMILFTDTLRPRRITINHPARRAAPRLPRDAPKDIVRGFEADAALDMPEDEPVEQRTEIDYLFDRITIDRYVDVIQTTERMRQLPFSFDVEQLPLLVRLLKYTELERQGNWPFEAFVTVPQRKQTRQLLIERPRRADLMSAEPANYPVYELTMRLDEATWTWWVERRAPHRLVRFSDGTLTYSLNEFVPLNSY